MQKQAVFKIKGMQRDLSVSAFNSDYAYENKNVRITPTKEDTLFSLTNEKGNKTVDITGIGDHIKGIPIGQSLLNNELIVFTCGDDSLKKEINIEVGEFEINNITASESDIDLDFSFYDRIYKLKFEGENLKGEMLFRGDLNFNYDNPIETIVFFENEELKKVYWTDGLNQPRVVNIAASQKTIENWNDKSFDFITTLKLKEKIKITKDNMSVGTFSPGTIQYAFTYFNKYGQESNIFQVSPLYYISYSNRGGSPEDKINNSFNIEIDYVDRNFDYLRIYSIHRTSINATPEVKRVTDIAIPSSDYTKYIVSEYEIYKKESDISIIDNNGISKNINSLSPDYTGENYKSWKISGSENTKILFGNTSYILLRNKQELLLTIYNNIKVKVDYTTIKVDTFTLFDKSRTKITYTDTGLSGDYIDPTDLFYIGGNEVVFGTFTQKDNTLFLGDINIKRGSIPIDIKQHFKQRNIVFSNNEKEIKIPKPSGYYPYENQLKYNAKQIKTFKYLEYYRFGIQLQHYTGKWSEPIWINDVQNTIHINSDFDDSETPIGLPIAKLTLSNENDKLIINKLISLGYVNIRPVIVYPNLQDREVLCQGILCPTVYNVGDRFSNAPFTQSSWFIRPNAPFDVEKSKNDWEPLHSTSYTTPSIYSRAGIMENNRVKVSVDDTTYDFDLVSKGSWAEFRHNYPIPSNNERNAEIQCIASRVTQPTLRVTSSGSDRDRDPLQDTIWVETNKELYFIDQSIITLHSPDIEFDTDIQNIDTSNIKMRIVGIVPMTSFISDIDIQTSTPVNSFKDSSNFPIGFYKKPLSVENEFTTKVYTSTLLGDSHFGWRGLISGAFWFDEITGLKADNPNEYTTSFVVYPWHRNGSLNNTKFASEGYRSAMLDKKKMSNLKYSYNSQYFDSEYVWNAEDTSTDYVDLRTGISGVSIFNSNEISVLKVPAPRYSKLEDINYYGNVDKILTLSNIKTKTTEGETANDNGYPIIISGTLNTNDRDNSYSLFTGEYNNVNLKNYSDQYTGLDPVRIKYKSSPHAVLALNYCLDGTDVIQRVLPTIQDSGYDNSGTKEYWAVNNTSKNITQGFKYFWDKDSEIKGVSQDVIKNTNIQGADSVRSSYLYGWLWLGELYRDNVQNRFGGQTEEAFENNEWVPCGISVPLTDVFEINKNSIVIKWEEGDTYYQRYDHIKTYPFTLEEQNAVTEVVSFMCETRINLDGRYDRNRGQTNNLIVTPENFNKINSVYSQSDNFFSYRGSNTEKQNLNTFRNIITWTKTKTAGELTDAWTNITLASTLDLDGDKGNIRALRKFNNNILAFQDKGISQILYNESMQIASTEGVPIEIANSGKVNGKRYITNDVGCINKWSICETPNGIYFIDDTTKGIFLFNGQLNNISDKLGFHSWIHSALKSSKIWNPVDFNGFITYYDKTNSEVLFINKNECLAFSESLGQFTSFYSYEKMPYFTNFIDRRISINTENSGKEYKVWLHNEGDYNMFFGKYQPFYTTIIVNPNATKDKIFNILEFRADSWNSEGILLNTTFDTLTTWNEYQKGKTSLVDILGRPSNLKKKFRIWRANIPRDRINGRDRMRNPWLYIKLSMDNENVNKTILHDIVVQYFE